MQLKHALRAGKHKLLRKKYQVFETYPTSPKGFVQVIYSLLFYLICIRLSEAGSAKLPQEIPLQFSTAQNYTAFLIIWTSFSPSHLSSITRSILSLLYVMLQILVDLRCLLIKYKNRWGHFIQKLPFKCIKNTWIIKVNGIRVSRR